MNARPRPGPHVAVVGGGISGLAGAHRLRTLLGPDARITLVESSARVGGVLVRSTPINSYSPSLHSSMPVLTLNL